jgi:hypothetical protein
MHFVRQIFDFHGISNKRALVSLNLKSFLIMAMLCAYELQHVYLLKRKAK